MVKKKYSVYAMYVAVFLASLWSFGNTKYTYTTNIYNLALDKYKYQLSNPNVYASVFSYPSDDTVETIGNENNCETEISENTIYLTFDDGPSVRTGEILDILGKYNIKATFFVVKGEENYTELMKRASREGHAIGIHSASHKYDKIYRSVQDFIDDFSECYEYITTNTEIKPTVSRFPGGSVNKHNSQICKQLIDEISRRGFQYFDWNVDSGDGTGKLSSREIYNNVINGCKGRKRAIVIMHDAGNKKTTVEALDDIINTLINDGWQFATLDNEVKPMVFRIK